ncbi:MAG TPA: protease SohB [Gammaproteobacteria bacterium]|nr:protease SohB [Gammaproteobacteria bacterium]
MSEFLAAYGLFLAQLATFVLLIIIAFVVISASRRRGHADGLVVDHLNRRFEDTADELKLAIDGKGPYKKAVKARQKERKRQDKARAKETSSKPRMFVLDFKGDLRASAAASLREEVSAVLRVAKAGEQVLVRLENSGGTVHEHGFAASQLTRLKQHNLKLLVAVDKVAASGGYLMACVADRLYAAPFAIIGSIGVLAQLPNFHRLLEEKGVDYEQIMAGRYKRTLTMFGKNTDEGRAKLQQEVEDIHELFKGQIVKHRPQVDVESVATGEHWYGIRALELKLVDEIKTSDDLLLDAAKDFDLYHLAYKRRRSFQERMLGGVDSLLTR